MNGTDTLFDALRQKAERRIVFPLNRDECLKLTDALIEIRAQAASNLSATGEFKQFCAYVEHVASCALNDEDWLA